MNDTATLADAVLAKELTPPPGITFDLDGKTYELDRPFTMRLWLKLFMVIKGDPGSDDAEWFTLNVAAHAEDVVLWATGLTAEQFRALPTASKVCESVAAQLGEELADASPFSSPKQALATLHRANLLAQRLAEASKSKEPGGTPA